MSDGLLLILAGGVLMALGCIGVGYGLGVLHTLKLVGTLKLQVGFYFDDDPDDGETVEDLLETFRVDEYERRPPLKVVGGERP